LSETICSLARILNRLLEERKRLGSTLNDPRIVSKLEKVMPSCHSTLRAMDTVLTRYNLLGDTIKASRNLWRRVKLGNGELVSVEDLRRKLATDTEALTMIVGTVQILQDKSEESLQTKSQNLGTIRSRYEEKMVEVEVEKQQSEGDITPELRQKLAEIEKEYNEVGRESARAFLPKSRVSSSEITGSPFAGDSNVLPNFTYCLIYANI
jgi:hypothetical protein